MNRFGKSWITFLTYSARIATLLLVINMVACSGSSRTPIGGDSGFDTNADNQDLFNENTNTTNTNAPTFDENIFNQQVGSDPTGSGVDQVTEPTTTDQQCLTQDAGLFNNVGTGQNTSNPACFQSLQNFQGGGQMGPFFNAAQQNSLPQFMMNTATSSFGLSDRCMQMAMMVPQFYGSQQNMDWNEIFRITKMGLTRCVRAINQWQSTAAPWAYNQRNVFDYNDNSLWRLMSNFNR